MGPTMISCIIPVFNGARYLGEAINSVLQQSYRPIEIIVVDDGSTDDTAAVARAYGDQIRYVRQANAGPAAARNHGVALASGQWIAMLDADDLWHPAKLARQMSYFEQDSELAVCATLVRNFWSPDVEAPPPSTYHPRLFEPWSGGGSMLLAQRDVFETVGRFNTELLCSDDGEWWSRMVASGVRRTVIPEVLVFRRLHDANLTRREATRSEQELLELVKVRLDLRRKAPL